MTARKPKWDDCSHASLLRLTGLSVNVWLSEDEVYEDWPRWSWSVEVADPRGSAIKELEGIEPVDTPTNRAAAKRAAVEGALELLRERAAKIEAQLTALGEVSP